jgi:hypothetical protein
MVRQYTNKILELVDEGVLDQRQLIRELLMWMPERDVKRYYELAGLDEDYGEEK